MYDELLVNAGLGYAEEDESEIAGDTEYDIDSRMDDYDPVFDFGEPYENIERMTLVISDKWTPHLLLLMGQVDSIHFTDGMVHFDAIIDPSNYTGFFLYEGDEVTYFEDMWNSGAHR